MACRSLRDAWSAPSCHQSAKGECLGGAKHAELRPDTIVPTPEEDAAINAGIAADPDTEELDDAWFARAPARFGRGP